MHTGGVKAARHCYQQTCCKEASGADLQLVPKRHVTFFISGCVLVFAEMRRIYYGIPLWNGKAGCRMSMLGAGTDDEAELTEWIWN